MVIPKKCLVVDSTHSNTVLMNLHKFSSNPLLYILASVHTLSRNSCNGWQFVSRKSTDTWEPQQMDCSDPAVSWSSPRERSTTTPAWQV